MVAINTATDRRTITDRLDLSEIGLPQAHGIHDWRAGTAVIGTSIEVELDARDWAMFVCCPDRRRHVRRRRPLEVRHGAGSSLLT